MDPTWSAYSQHFSRLGASMNHPPGALAQQAQMNDLALSSSLPRQEHIPGYGNAGGPHHFLLSHGLNPSQANHNDPSFNANLFAANYDASLFSSSFPAANKGHLSSFPHFKAVGGRDSDFNDLRTGFSHCGMSAYAARNSEGNNAGLGSAAGHLFPNSMPPGSWRHSGMIPSSCGPFGVLPHETVLQRSHLVGRGGEKLQGSKQSRSSHPSSSFVEQDLSRGYRSILSSPARPPSSYVDSSNTSHSSLLSPQSDPYFSSVSDNYYSSCSKNDFAAYSSYCSQPPGVQRSSISPYCYSQTFGNFADSEKPTDVPPTTSTSTSANPNFTNFVPNNGLNGNPSHLHNGQISRQSVITSNINNSNSSMYNSESHPQNHPYNVREAYPYPPGAAHASSCLPNHPSNSRGEPNGSRQASIAHMNSSHTNNSHPPSGQNLYPPMSTPIPASTPAHTTPPSSSMGQAYVPTPLPMSHDSGCSVNSQSVMYHSPSNDGCYSTPGTCPSESGSPAKQDLSQHSSPSVYSIESSNLSMNSGQFVDSHHVRPHSSSDVGYNVANGGLTSDNASDSSKVVDENLREAGPALMASTQQKDVHLPQVLPIDMVKMNKDSSSTYHNAVDARFDGRQANLVAPPSQPHIKHADQTRSECSVNAKGDAFPFAESPPALDFTAKGKLKCKQSRKRKCDNGPNPLPLNCTYSHLQNNQSSPQTPEDAKSPQSAHSQHASPLAAAAANDLPAAVSASPAPVDLSHSVDLSVKKQDSPAPPENKESKEPLPDLNYETDKASGGKWSLTKQDTPESKSKEESPAKLPEDTKEETLVEKDSPKQGSPLCGTPPIDDLSSESKKLCNSIDDDLGFLAGLSSDPDVEDSVSKGSFSEKKVKKEKGFLQSFLTFLESSNEPNVTSDSTPLEEKPEKAKKVSEPPPKSEESSKKQDEPSTSSETLKSEDTKDTEESRDKDNFDEAPSLDPSLFGCSTLQKEMVVPNPEAPSFSSDEDENSTQGIFDSVAMAIQRLCEDNEEEHSEKGNKASSSSKGNCSKKDTSAAPVDEDVEMKDVEALKSEGVEECTIKRACVARGRRGKRRRTRHLLVIKVKGPAERVVSTPMPKTVVPKAAPKVRRMKAATKEKQAAKGLPATPRRPLMRKCKEKGQSRKRTRATKRKTRNCVKRKYAYDTEESSSAVPEVKDSKVAKEVITDIKMEISESPPAAFVPPQQPTTSTAIPPSTTVAELPVEVAKQAEASETSQPSTPIRPMPPKKKKVNKTIGYRTRKRRRKPRKQSTESVESVQQGATEVSEQMSSAATKEATITGSTTENPETQPKPPSSSSESCWSTETHFKTGDFVITIDGKNSENPPIWRIEGKNVLQLFEVQENNDGNSILYRNTSSYSRWSPSSKHKYLKQLVKIIKSDDDTVIVELIKSSENLADKESSGSCDYTIHPQRENFEVYLQTLVSHALDPDFIPEIIKEKDEYFLSHLQAIEEVTSQKKSILQQEKKWGVELFNFITLYPSVNAVASKDENGLCQVCQNCKVQFVAHFQGQPYDPLTLENVPDQPAASDISFPLCGLCVQTVTLYSRLHHHKYHFFQEGCKKVKDVKKGEEKDSHTILEECLQDAEWMTQMFQDMLEMWNSCDKYR